MRITHPFHPLRGQRFPLLYRGHTGEERWVVLQRPDGSVLRLPDLVRLAESVRLILREGEL